MAYVYRHIRLDKNEPFYIGIGSDDNYKRANSKDKRSAFWKDIIKKTEYRVEIILDGLTWKEACEKEIELISLYGRSNIKNGTLCNLTNGGEGMLGYVMSKSTKEKMIKSIKEKYKNGYINPMKGKNHTDNHKVKNSTAQKERYLNGYINPMKGKNHSNESIEKNRDSNKKLYENGYINPNSKMVINLENGIFYDSAKTAFESQEQVKNYYTFVDKLKGRIKNNTPFQFA